MVGEDAEDSEFSEVRQMKGQRIAPSAQLDSIQNPKRLGVLFATKLHTDIIFIVMMILKTSNAVNVSQEEEERKNGNENATAGVAAVIEINFDCELCDFVSRHRYNFKRHLKRMHGKTEIEAEELAKEEDKKKTNEHAAADEQEEVEVEHPDNAAVGDQEDHEPVEYEEPAAQQEVRQNMDLNQILTSVGLEEYYSMSSSRSSL